MRLHVERVCVPEQGYSSVVISKLDRDTQTAWTAGGPSSRALVICRSCIVMKGDEHWKREALGKIITPLVVRFYGKLSVGAIPTLDNRVSGSISFHFPQRGGLGTVLIAWQP